MTRLRSIFTCFTVASVTSGARTCSAQNANITSPQRLQFRLALPGYKFQFPRDHGSHPEFRTEWWYYTGHLRDKTQRRFGYQLTFFRTALAPEILKRSSKWASRDVMFAHFALTDERGQRFFTDDRISRKALGLAGAEIATSKPPRIWLGDWNIQFTGKRGQSQAIRAQGRARNQNDAIFAIDLKHSAVHGPIEHGQNGVSQKSSGVGRASHYYSFTRLNSVGKVTIGNQNFSVEGQSWFDHEFGSSQLSSQQTGWDWFSLQLSDGRDLMLYQLRLQDGQTDPFSSGTIISSDGKARHLKRSDFSIGVLNNWRSPHTNGVYPAQWRVKVPREKISLTITPTLPDQELNTSRSTGISYWEGLVNATGSSQKGAVTALGYVELTGYDKRFKGTF